MWVMLADVYQHDSLVIEHLYLRSYIYIKFYLNIYLVWDYHYVAYLILTFLFFNWGIGLFTHEKVTLLVNIN